jgi:medium-chain acyl-CoA synthetase
MPEYEAARAAFRWRRPERFNFARDVVDPLAADPERSAMLWVDDTGRERHFAFAHFSAASRRLCHVLGEAGVQRGDSIILMLPRIPEWWECLLAGLRMGAVVAPATVQLSPQDLRYRIGAAGAACVITDMAGAEKVDIIAAHCPSLKARLLVDGARPGWIDCRAAQAAAPNTFETADTRADEEALCYFTSGTTGYPKMCMHRHDYALGHETTGRYWLDLYTEDLHWNVSDTGWAKAAWSSLFGPWNRGARIFVHHTAGAFDPTRTLSLLEQYPVTTLCAAPTVYRMLVLEDLQQYRFATLRHCVSAGEPLNPEVIAAWRRATGITIRDGYGQTETVILCGNFPCLEARPGSMGRPAPGIDLQVIDEHGNVLPAGTEGEIAVRVRPERPLGLFSEYRNDPERTGAAFRGDWYVTGDRAVVDADGYFWFVARADDVIISAGYRIGPFEVESALIEHPAVAESAVVGAPDATRGQVVKAFVVLAPGYLPGEALKQELQEHVKRVTAPYKYPRQIEFADALPKTVSGKIRRVELRNRHQ